MLEVYMQPKFKYRRKLGLSDYLLPFILISHWFFTIFFFYLFVILNRKYEQIENVVKNEIKYYVCVWNMFFFSVVLNRIINKMFQWNRTTTVKQKTKK